MEVAEGVVLALSHRPSSKTPAALGMEEEEEPDPTRLPPIEPVEAEEGEEPGRFHLQLETAVEQPPIARYAGSGPSKTVTVRSERLI